MSEDCTILLIEDNDADAFLLKTYLSEAAEFRIDMERSERLRPGLELLARRRFDLVLLDLNLPDSRGIDTLRKVLVQAPEHPVVVLTGLDDSELGLETVHLGAQDYLVKDHINAGALRRVVRYSLERHRFLARLKEVDRLKSSFVSMASHEMRTPLAIIREFVSLVRDGVTGEIGGEQADCLDAALRNCDRLADLLNDLLDLGRIEAGKLRLRRKEVDIGPLLKQVYNDFQPRCDTKGQSLDLEIGETLPPVLCDASRITQVLVNLVGNAHKFTPEGGGIRIAVEANGNSVRIDVEDNGRGIKPNDLEVIFDAFTQLSRRDHPGTQGTGLGLAISKSIVDLHEGNLGAESEYRKGSRFWFDLPAFREEQVLPAFVKDGWRLARSDHDPVSLALLQVADDAILEEVQALAGAVFRIREDDSILVEKSRLLAFLLHAGEDDCAGLLDRFRDKLAGTFNAPVEIDCGISEFQRSYSAEDWLQLARRKLEPLGAGPSLRERRRILVVDDDETILGLIVDALKRANLGFDVQATTSGYDACVRFGEFEPDVVILDINLQDIDGTEVFRSMRRGAHGSVARFLAISGLVSRIGEMMELGCTASMAKPFELSALVEKAADLLQIGGSYESPSRTDQDGRREASCH